VVVPHTGAMVVVAGLAEFAAGVDRGALGDLGVAAVGADGHLHDGRLVPVEGHGAVVRRVELDPDGGAVLVAHRRKAAALLRKEQRGH